MAREELRGCLSCGRELAGLNSLPCQSERMRTSLTPKLHPGGHARWRRTGMRREKRRMKPWSCFCQDRHPEPLLQHIAKPSPRWRCTLLQLSESPGCPGFSQPPMLHPGSKRDHGSERLSLRKGHNSFEGDAAEHYPLVCCFMRGTCHRLLVF